MPSFISAIGTALPEHLTPQTVIADFMIKNLKLNDEEEKKLRVLYRASGIKQRYSVLKDFGNNLNGQAFFSGDREFPSLKPRMVLYEKEALKLAALAIDRSRQRINLPVGSFTHLITVSCTGMYAPGLGIELVEKLGFNNSIQRTAINFMGCYAAFNALKLADQIVRADSEARVMIVCVELCSIHLQDAKDDNNILANSLFGDGAAAVIVTSGGFNSNEFQLECFHNDLAPSGKDEMGWHIGDFGFEMKLTHKVPDVIREGIETLTNRLLNRLELSVSDIPFFAIHPGGKRILSVIEETLGIKKEDNFDAHEVLRMTGNMSSPTVLFVLKSLSDRIDFARETGKRILSFAFGPGLTLESMLLKIKT